MSWHERWVRRISAVMRRVGPLIVKSLIVFLITFVLGLMVAALIGTALEEADARRHGISLDDGAVTGRTP